MNNNITNYEIELKGEECKNCYDQSILITSDDRLISKYKNIKLENINIGQAPIELINNLGRLEEY